MTTTTTQEHLAIAIAQAIVETIWESPDGAPGGHLYAATMQHLSHDQFERIMAGLMRAGVIRKSGHCYYPAKRQ